MEQPYRNLLVERRDDGILLVTFNRPEKLNAFDRRFVAEIEDALAGGEHDDQVKAVVLTGTGRGWCAGNDFSGNADPADAPPERGRSGHHELNYSLSQRVFSYPKPVIAAVNGYTLGMGLGICAACDVRFASSEAKFSTMFVKRALASDYGAAYLLQQHVGRQQTLAWLWSAEMLDAGQAQAIGFVYRVTEPERLLDEVIEWLQPVVHGPSVAIETIKRLVNYRRGHEFAEYLLVEEHLQSGAARTEDFQEGVRSFREKRAAVFQGR